VKSRLLHQAAIYWGATAADEAKKRKVTSEQFSADQASYRRTQGLLLATGDPGAETQVSACVTHGNR
jgi:hypothetical protein